MSGATTFPPQKSRDSSAATVVFSSSSCVDVGGGLPLRRSIHEKIPTGRHSKEDIKLVGAPFENRGPTKAPISTSMPIPVSNINIHSIPTCVANDHAEAPLIARLKNVEGNVASVTVELNGSSISHPSPTVTSIVSDSSGVDNLPSLMMNTHETTNSQIVADKSERAIAVSSQELAISKKSSLCKETQSAISHAGTKATRKVTDPSTQLTAPHSDSSAKTCIKNRNKRMLQFKKNEDDSGHSDSDQKPKQRRLDVEDDIKKMSSEVNNTNLMDPRINSISDTTNAASFGTPMDSTKIKAEDDVKTSNSQEKKRSVVSSAGAARSGNSPKRKVGNSTNSKSGGNKSKTQGPIAEMRWRAHRAAEDYVDFVANMIYPSTYLCPFGYNYKQGQYPVERPCTLGVLLSPLRRPTVIERWNPFEIASFEAAISLYGKDFHLVQQIVKTKTTKEVVEFYYIWKKTSHYKRWKRQYEADVESDGEDILANEITKK
mmetsp:Transcript_30185/g.69195  ORF Transcript_30185/g.69195 Transcript_30185/m.69195 type:complete len:488 (-) Transcript_30185:502-1965(-)|eukprot:CAMPEP_0113298748 /NCGR_PEP_ID=MMETSP0010_2-20120614/1061_1 /TAXON_ID=216773 ORGANISM="Corethron hystrix, Strain 308" /NCGR_SAMPLE_ID=MMETSP0010_2 /ASSEMBLY_ACC=CAM_ASM_000155 /LENGTH=487 /DNA_ID=CAMNT_0000151849 /DNA_START=195 /DNA_END=1658 /DNA_ORIENTATION=+ /assembly_acc=CAM_ASM_000155